MLVPPARLGEVNEAVAAALRAGLNGHGPGRAAADGLARTVLARTAPGRDGAGPERAPADIDGPDLDEQVVVLTVSQAKGLEFDSVLIADPAQILGESPRGLSDLYVAMTRATQRLGVVHPGPVARRPAQAGPAAMTAPVPEPGRAPSQGTPVPEPPAFWDAAQIRQVSHQVADLVADYLTGLPGGPAYQPPPRGLVEAMRAAGWAEQGEPAGAVLAEFAAHVAPYPFGNGHPGFAAWVNSPPHPLGVLAEALAAAMDPSVAGGNHAAVHLEHQVIRWFAGLLGWSGEYSRPAGQRRLRRDADRARRGPAPGRRRGREPTTAGTGWPGWRAAWCSTPGTESHSCVTKAAEVLGLGSAAIQVVPVGPGPPDAAG